MGRSLAAAWNGSTTAPPVTALPMTFACWFKHANLVSGSEAIIGIADSASSQGYRLCVTASPANNVMVQHAGSATGSAITTATFTSDVWQHAAGVFTSASSRAVYVNGGNVISNATAVTSGTPNQLMIGLRPVLSDQQFVGSLAEIGIWNVVLNADEISALAKGVPPTRVRPSALVAYYPFRAGDDLGLNNVFRNATSRSLTGSGTTPTATDHPPVFPAFGEVFGWRGNFATPVTAISLTASDLAASSPTLDAGTITQAYVLAATVLAAGSPALGASALTQGHALAVTVLAGSAPTLGAAAVGQKHVLAASAASAGAPILGVPAATISNVLSAVNSTVAAPSVGTTTLAQIYNLTGGLVVGQPIIDIGFVKQKHVLASSGFVDSSPTFGTIAFSAGRQLVATSFASGAPSIASATSGQKHALIATSKTVSAPTLGVSSRPIITITLVPTGFTISAPTFASATARLSYVLHAANLATHSPSSATPPQIETLAPPLVWLQNRLKRWSNDPNDVYYDEDGTQNEGPLKEAIFSNHNDDIILEASTGTLVGRTAPHRGPAEMIQPCEPLYLSNRKLWIDINQLAEELAGLEVIATLPTLSGVSADLNLLNDKILIETAARKAAVTTEANARAAADATETNARTVADTTEINARTAADTVLDAKITTETNARTTAVTAEANARTAADAALDARLVVLETRSYVDRGGVAIIAPASGFVHNVAADAGVVIINPPGNLTSGTFKLPTAPDGRQKIDFIATKKVNTLVFSTDNSAHALANPPSTVVEGKCITAVFGPALQTWLFFA